MMLTHVWCVIYTDLIIIIRLISFKHSNLNKYNKDKFVLKLEKVSCRSLYPMLGDCFCREWCSYIDERR